MVGDEAPYTFYLNTCNAVIYTSNKKMVCLKVCLFIKISAYEILYILFTEVEFPYTNVKVLNFFLINLSSINNY
jgi:hypothetical protein